MPLIQYGKCPLNGCLAKTTVVKCNITVTTLIVDCRIDDKTLNLFLKIRAVMLSFVRWCR